ncbi:MAG: VOC family protein [Xanthobacteraceae bacterium]|nr:VOC family protein [Xanthobacteraceae bacterium]
MARLVQSVTVLEVKDIKRSEAFYREKLGFRPGLFFGEPPTFCIVSRDSVTLFLDLARTPRAAPLNQYWATYLYVDDVNAMAAELSARGVTIEREPEDQPYGCRDFDIRDPDGHVIGIGQNELSAEGKLTLPYA